MLIDYLNWQFVVGPKWLMLLLWNLERASLCFFSIKLMFRTLLAYWHKDAMAFSGGTLSKYATILLWNLISRLIGFIVRSVIIILWLLVQTVFLPLAGTILVLFVLWPILLILGLAIGLSLFLV